jgi:hypothetical protein
MNSRTIALLIGLGAGLLAAGLVSYLETRLRRQKRGWIVPLSLVSLLALMCALLFSVNWDDLYHRSPYPFYGALAFLVAFAAIRRLAIFASFVGPNTQGRINSPRNRARVPRLFRAEGTIDRLPADQYLLLVVQVGGLMWPKGQVQVDDGSWRSEVHEVGTPPNGEFTLSLYLVRSGSYDGIADWLERGQATGDYPGLRRIEDGIRLHSVRLRLKSA